MKRKIGKLELIKTMDVCKVTSNKGIKGSGLSAGDVVQVIGTRVLPEKRNDPYLQRIYVLTLKFEGEKLLVPNDSNEYSAILMDPRRLEKVDKETQVYYEGLIKEQYDSSG